MSKKRVIILLIIIAVAFSGYFIYSRSQNKPVLVTQVEPEMLKVRKTVSSSGAITSQNEADLAIAAVGVLQNLYIEEGDEVTAGQVLGNVSNYDSYQTSEAYREAVDVTKRDLDIYIENYETNADAVGGEDEYDLNLRRLQELINRAQATYQSSLGSLSNTVLKSPFDGTVVDIYKKQGEVVTAGTPIAKIADLQNLVFEIELDQEDFGIIVPGQEVIIMLDSYPSTEFKGNVSELPLYADETSADFTVQTDIFQNGSDTPVLLGMKGDAEIIVYQSSQEVTVLPFDAVFEDNEGTYIWFNNNGQLDKTHIETGEEGDIYTEIKTDLANFQIVIPQGDTDPQTGMTIKYE